VYIQTYGYYGCCEKNEIIIIIKKQNKYKIFFIIIMEDIPECVLQLNYRCENNIIDMNASTSENQLDYMIASSMNYNENFTVKMLKNIALYYGFKSSSKTKKQDLIDFIVNFEQNELHGDIVSRRCTLWSYIDALMEDPFTKKFVINMNH
jgi:hypothetical protein